MEDIGLNRIVESSHFPPKPILDGKIRTLNENGDGDDDDDDDDDDDEFF